jgi:hypothetical protein
VDGTVLFKPEGDLLVPKLLIRGGGGRVRSISHAFI